LEYDKRYTCDNIVELGEGNFCGDPLFVFPAWGTAGDYHLQFGSPAIDSGICTGAPPVDFEGDPRPMGANCDIGADEFASIPVRVFSPNGKEEVPAGGNYTIQWQATSNAHHFTLQLSSDNRQTWSIIARDITGTSYNWAVPVPENNKRLSFIRVTAFDSSNNRIGSDRSDKPFTIEVVKVTAPNGGEILKSGSTYTITWRTNATIRPIAKVQIFYTLDGGASWKLIKAFNGTNPGIHKWRVPVVDSAKTQCKVKVLLRDSANVVIGSDVSDRFFTIEQ